MKSRLFWKILLGFWITIICLLQGVWIAYSVLWSERSSFEHEVARIVAPYQLAAAKMAIETGGLERYEALLAQWREEEVTSVSQSQGRGEGTEWTRLTIADSGSVGSSAASTGSSVLIVRATDPRSKSWELRYMLPKNSRYDPWSLREFMRFYLTIEWAIPSLFCGFLFSAILAWYLTRPMQRLRNGFRALADGALDTRLRSAMGRRRDEIADLANDFDRMAERLQQLVVARDRLLHDVSHELRSPLARLNLAVALAAKDAGIATDPLNRIASEVRRLDELVGELLSLSRRESGGSEPDTYFDMRALLESVVADARFEAQSQGIAIEWVLEAGKQTLMQGSAELIRRAVENILRNAIQFSKRGDVVEVRLTVDEGARQVVLWIADRGPGVHEPDLQRMHEPFVRLHSTRDGKGYGLGLAIASRAVLSHKGTLAAQNRRGGGLAVTLILPLAEIAPDLVDRILENEE